MRGQIEDDINVCLIEPEIEPCANRDRRAVPADPVRTNSRSLCTAALCSKVWPGMSRTPAALAASRRCRAAPVVVAIGFSMSTCLPASMALSPNGAWLAGGVAMTTASTWGKASSMQEYPVTPWSISGSRYRSG